MCDKRLFFVLIFFLIGSIVPSINAGEMYIEFDIQSRSELHKLTRMISIDRVDNLSVYANVTEQELAAIIDMGYRYQIQPHPRDGFVPDMASSRDQLREWDVYPTYETYVDMMYQYAEDYPDLCTVENIGYSVQGREILFAKITDNVSSEEDEPEFMYSAQMHGDELVGFIMMLRLIDYLLSNYGEDDRITNLVDNVEIWINPLANPDGTYQGGNHTVSGAVRRNANGVDINRNFPDPDGGPHPDGYSWQPETFAMMNLETEHHFVLSSNIHSGAEVVNYPWDTWSRRTADDEWWQHVCRTYADAVHENAPAGYMDGFDDGVTNGYDWYEVAGGRQDYIIYFHRGREMTLELSNAKMLPANQLPAHWNYNRESFLLYIEECLYGIRGMVTSSTREPVAAKITVVDHDMDNSEVLADSTFGNYHRMIAPGTYDLLFTAFGHETQSVENVVVSDNQITIVNMVMEASPMVTVDGTVTDNETGQPIFGAIVELINTDYPSETTDSEGYYQISNVYAGTYALRTSAVGYATLTQEVDLYEDNSQIDFQLAPSDAESFETGAFTENWNFGGNANWVIDNSVASDGFYSAKSGDISSDQSSSLSIALETISDGVISFYRKVSCEDDSNNNYDFLSFKIDGSEQARWDGESDWTEVNFVVSAGAHTFQWVYEKDGNISSGSDCAWIDYINFPPTAGDNDPLIIISVDELSFGNVQIGESATQSYTVQCQELTDNFTITARTVFSLSVDNQNFDRTVIISPTNGEIPETTIYARFQPAAGISYIGTISHESESAVSQSIQVAGQGISPPDPEISLSTDSILFGEVTIGEESIQNYTVQGVNLNAPIEITAPSGFTLSSDGEIFSQTLTLSLNREIRAELMLKFSPVEAIAYSGAVTHQSQGAETQDLIVQGVGREANRPPMLQNPILDQEGLVGLAFEFQFNDQTFMDPDGDDLIYSALLADNSLLPDWLNFDSENRLFSGTPTEGGILEIEVVAQDEGGVEATDNFQLSIYSRGDMNSDGYITAADISLLVEHIIFGAEYSQLADMDQNGLIDVRDIISLVDQAVQITRFK
ncbi:MAG: hypothetical protein B6244_04510 [Candidatus Cloacimonetes bacterium 4572_55]|nr:MAG: hypothetical protein B6244_04510 [Candidatus Cloacimonetes bacterium 4572_55]